LAEHTDAASPGQVDMSLITGPLDVYDYLTFLVLIVAIVAFFSIFVFIGGLPGKIAMKRRHPHAESVKIMGWAGFLAVVPWIHSFIWAFHDSLTVDIRRYPEAEKKAIDEELNRLGLEDGGASAEESPPQPKGRKSPPSAKS
jgi:hypothetical protein